MSAVVTPAYLSEYGLDPNNAILADAKHRTIYEELPQKYKISCSPGGATQNTIRVAQWNLKAGGSSCSTSFVGCIGSDQFAQTLQKCMTSEGITTSYMIDEKEGTGICTVLITDNNRSLVINCVIV